MAQEIIPKSSFERAAERVRSKRETTSINAEPITLNSVTGTTNKVRARLNFIPDDSLLGDMINQALTALSRGVRWARGSIINLIV